jgi:hypothetical protein
MAVLVPTYGVIERMDGALGSSWPEVGSHPRWEECCPVDGLLSLTEGYQAPGRQGSLHSR